MFTFILDWTFRGERLFTVFAHGYQRRKSGRRYLLQPSGVASMDDLTAYEVGQLLGGN